MMPTIHPCFGCTERHKCDIRRAVVIALRGQPVTKAKIKCERPWRDIFPPGTRVLVTVWDAANESHWDSGVYDRSLVGGMVPATVIGKSTKKPGKLLTQPDVRVTMLGGEKLSFVTAWPKDLKRLDEPLRAMCSICNCAMLPDGGGCSREGEHEKWEDE
jgi:hypothetical protein